MENDILRSKIKELENTLQSIRSGEVDSVLSSDGKKIYSISSVETSFRYMIEQLSTGLAVLSNKNSIIYCNHSFSEILETKLSQVIDSKFVNFFNKKTASLIKENLEKGDLGNRTMEVAFQSKLVENKYLIITFSPLDIETAAEFNRHFDNTTHFVITINDITELKKIQTDYRKLSMDLEEKVIDRTQQLEELNKKLLTSKRASLNLMEDAIEAKNKIEKINEQLQDEITIRKNSELQTKKLNEELATQNEEYENLNEELRQTIEELEISKKKAEESDRLKSAFLANMSHEIRTPMNGILGFAKLLSKPNLTGERQQEFIDIIQISSHRMLTTINDIVEISKIEAGGVEPSYSEVNLNQQMDYFYNFFLPEAQVKGIQLFYKKALPDTASDIKSDVNMLSSILINLIKNALKFTDEGRIDFGYEVQGKNIKFYCTDTGIGIPKIRQEAIFDRFIQADISDRRAAQGSGLGLSISKAYTEMLGGEIWLESKENIGTTFHVTLPHTATHIAKVATEENNFMNTIKDLKILIVEDDETSSLHLSTLLNDAAKEIIHATTGSEAIEYCMKLSDIDLILMDINLPHTNGYKVTQIIREFNKDVIIIAQTAYAMQEDRKKALDAGCNDYITKPIDEKELQHTISKYFKK